MEELIALWTLSTGHTTDDLADGHLKFAEAVMQLEKLTGEVFTAVWRPDKQWQLAFWHKWYKLTDMVPEARSLCVTQIQELI